VDTTPQPETTEKTAEKKNGSNKTSLALSAIAIAIALAAGVGLYGLVKQQGTNQTATSDALVNQLTALQKAQETQKPSWKRYQAAGRRSWPKQTASRKS
jgi:uroporphyrin-3 C-methyltransferase